MPELVPFTSVADVDPPLTVPRPPAGTIVSFIPMAAVSDSGQWVDRIVREIGSLGAGYTTFQEDDVLFAKITPCMENGKGCHARGLKNGIGYGSTEFIVLRAKPGNDARYVYHWTRSSILRKAAELSMSGSAGQQRVHSSFFGRYKVVRMEPLEQAAVGQVLDVVDQAIRQTAAVMEKLARIKVGLVLALLRRGIAPDGKLRDPKLHPEQFQRTSAGLLPKCWGMETVGNLCSHVGSGLTPTGGQKVYRKDGVLFIRSQNVTFEGLLLDDVAFIGLDTHRAMSRSEILPHDVLLNITGASIGRCCPFPAGLGPANVNQHVCSLRLGPTPREEDAVFLSQFLGSPFGQSQIDRLNAGSNRQGLNYAQIRSFVVPWPDEEERARIAAALRAVPARIESEKRLLRKLLRLKAGIERDLLSGRVRVPAELISAAADDPPEGKVVKLGANIHFKRAVLAAEVVDQMHGDITFGHVKFMKTLYLVEQLAELELESHYLRAAAGPFDNRLLRSVDALLSKKQWFDKVPRTGGKQNGQAGEKPLGWSYVPLAKRGEHRPWFEKYWGGAQAKIQAVINLLKPLDTQRCEILATLYEAWRALASEGEAVGDGAIVDEVLLRWHESKQAIPRERWLKALEWMRREGMIPKTALGKA